MVVDNFHLCWPCIRPAKTDAVLVINADAMLSMSIPFQGLKAVSWGNLEFMECDYRVKLIEFAGGTLPQ